MKKFFCLKYPTIIFINLQYFTKLLQEIFHFKKMKKVIDILYKPVHNNDIKRKGVRNMNQVLVLQLNTRWQSH